MTFSRRENKLFDIRTIKIMSTGLKFRKFSSCFYKEFNLINSKKLYTDKGRNSLNVTSITFFNKANIVFQY